MDTQVTLCVVIVLLALFNNVEIVFAQACQKNSPTLVGATGHEQYALTFIPACSTGNEIYLEKKKDSDVFDQYCCPPGKDANFFLSSAVACRITSCLPKTTTDFCTEGLDSLIFVNRTELQYVETEREECLGESGDSGIAALCCPPGSLEELLTSLVGAEPEEFPFFARVGKDGCGGTVYNEFYVIIAAHCVVDEEEKRLKSVATDGQEAYDNCCSTVRINILLRDITTVRTYDVEEITVYPNSSWTQPDAPPGISWGDVALVKLAKKIEFGDKVKALKIAEPGFDATKYGNYGFMTGFGTTDTLRQPLKMQKANMILRPKDQIDFMLSEHNQLMFAGGILNGIVSPDFGQGDSGGPFVCRDKNGMAQLCGVVSFLAAPTAECLANLDEESCRASSFNDVQYFHDWIQSVAGGQEPAELWNHSLHGKAVGGSEYPAHVHITSSEGDSCGGTLIEEDIVLTAASCVGKANGETKKGLQVTVGVKDLKTGGGKVIAVKTAALLGNKLNEVERPAWGGGGRKKRMVTLPYESWKAGKLANEKIQKYPYYKDNVALVKLAEKSGIGRKAAKLSTQTFHSGDIAMEVAYPTMSQGTASKGKLPLSKREFKLLDKQDCQARMDRLSRIPYDVKIDDNVICGVEMATGGSMCDRELGGGLYCTGADGKEVLCGVQVFRLCDFSIPNEFIDVSQINNWVNRGLKTLKSG